jgi:large subunit ribosomal protein L18
MSTLCSSSKKRRLRVRSRISERNNGQRAKISVFRSNKNISVQLVDVSGKVLHSFSSAVLDKKELSEVNGINIAKLVGSKFGKICVDNGIGEVVFDRGSYSYAGRVRALAESCREAGLKF